MVKKKQKKIANLNLPVYILKSKIYKILRPPGLEWFKLC
jgi:hypothetical protein